MAILIKCGFILRNKKKDKKGEKTGERKLDRFFKVR